MTRAIRREVTLLDKVFPQCFPCQHESCVCAKNKELHMGNWIPILSAFVPKKASATAMWLKSGQVMATVLTHSSSILIGKIYFYIILSLFYNVTEKFDQFSWARNWDTASQFKWFQITFHPWQMQDLTMHWKHTRNITNKHNKCCRILGVDFLQSLSSTTMAHNSLRVGTTYPVYSTQIIVQRLRLQVGMVCWITLR
jgi:hypothetical protein